MIDVDYILPSDEDRDEIAELSALGFSAQEIWIHFDKKWDKHEFMHDAQTPGCIIAHCIEKGKLQRLEKRMLNLSTLSSNGNVTADQQLQKIIDANKYRRLMDSIE